ncbi:leucine-rich repeat domain-containing protein [Thalassoroseus pseudoceratinae]|uniref:hypothetical protein n=1 Tax=Thalassoroseus pseudoceratinae TaxID=2713176 RepID=UPI00141FEB22|nr:hypothetical protein [Thalassoroseus pseudoceratinae]
MSELMPKKSDRMSVEEKQSPSRRLRWSLIVVELLGVFLALSIWPMLRYPEHQAAREAESLGGRIPVSWNLPEQPQWLWEFCRSRPIRPLYKFCFSTYRDAYFVGCHTSATESLESIEALQNLEKLCLEEFQVSSSDVERLKEFPDLNQLILVDCQLSSAAIEKIGELSQLDWLSLPRSSIEDVDIQHLAKLNKLRLLYVNSTGITDIGLLKLHSLKNLRWLNVAGTDVTEDGIQRLKTALPDLDIRNE